jgi:hypothetical protein
LNNYFCLLCLCLGVVCIDYNCVWIIFWWVMWIRILGFFWVSFFLGCLTLGGQVCLMRNDQYPLSLAEKD